MYKYIYLYDNIYIYYINVYTTSSQPSRPCEPHGHPLIALLRGVQLLQLSWPHSMHHALHGRHGAGPQGVLRVPQVGEGRFGALRQVLVEDQLVVRQ